MRKCIAFTVLVMLVSFSCNKPAETDNENIVSKEEDREIIHLDTVRNKPLKRELLLNGRVDFDKDEVTQVFPMASGVVRDVFFEIGDYVNKGDILALIESEEIASVIKERKSAEHKLKLAERNHKAIEDMFNAGLSSERDLLDSKQELTEAKAELQRINKVMGIYPTDDNGLYIIKSPVSGFITERNINKNYSIRQDRDEEVFTVAGLDRVWIIADVYESDISKIKEEQNARITTLSYRDKEFKGKVDRVYNILNKESKTMSIRIKLDNPDYLLKPGMFANVYIYRDNETKLYPSVPNKSVIFENGKHYVVVKDSDKGLYKKEVEVYKSDNDCCYLENGVNDGDIIVGKNALLVYSSLGK